MEGQQYLKIAPDYSAQRSMYPPSALQLLEALGINRHLTWRVPWIVRELEFTYDFKLKGGTGWLRACLEPPAGNSPNGLAHRLTVR